MRRNAAPYGYPEIAFVDAEAAIWFADGTLINSEDGIPNTLELSVLKELEEQLGNQNIRIIIRGKTYIIDKVNSPTNIQLTKTYGGATENDIRYATGGKLIGEPWEVKLPTELVIIDPNQTLAAIHAAIPAGG